MSMHQKVPKQVPNTGQVLLGKNQMKKNGTFLGYFYGIFSLALRKRYGFLFLVASLLVWMICRQLAPTTEMDNS
jgi:hypothetical protein